MHNARLADPPAPILEKPPPDLPQKPIGETQQGSSSSGQQGTGASGQPGTSSSDEMVITDDPHCPTDKNRVYVASDGMWPANSVP